jgi:hypothetical protein
VVLTFASLASGAPKKDQDQETTRIYQHTYDEVFQASQEAIERLGCFVTDKDKGTVSGSVQIIQKPGSDPVDYPFDLHIEALNTKPETRVTINTDKWKSIRWRGPTFSGWQIKAKESSFKVKLMSELQKTLATYH